jgi:hypothetical protein
MEPLFARPPAHVWRAAATPGTARQVDQLRFLGQLWRRRGALRAERRPEREPLDLALEVVRGEMAVELGRRARVLVPHDPLDRGEVGAAHEQQ